jgi:putative transcription antitermination factor YqgF
MLARPWKSIAVEASRVAAALAAEIAALRATEDGLHVIVLGLPRRLSGEPNEQTKAVESLAERLREAAVGVPIVLQDERLTSREAESLLARREKDWRKRKPLLDAAAAAVILQDYLDGQARLRPTEDLDQ